MLGGARLAVAGFVFLSALLGGCAKKTLPPPAPPPSASEAMKSILGTSYIIPDVQRRLDVGTIVERTGNSLQMVFAPLECLGKYKTPTQQLNIQSNGTAGILQARIEVRDHAKALFQGVATQVTGEEIGSYLVSDIRGVKLSETNSSMISIGNVDLDTHCQARLHQLYGKRVDNNRLEGIELVSEVLSADGLEVEFESQANMEAALKLFKTKALRTTSTTLRISAPVFRAVHLVKLEYIFVGKGGVVPPPVHAFNGNSAVQVDAPRNHIIAPTRSQ